MNAFITNLLTLRHLVICSRPLFIRLLVIMLCRLLVIRLLVKISNASSLALNSFILRRLVIHALFFRHPSIRPHAGSSLQVFRHPSSYSYVNRLILSSSVIGSSLINSSSPNQRMKKDDASRSGSSKSAQSKAI